MIDRRKLDLFRQWFDALQDVSPRYLEEEDYVLAKELYETLGFRVPHSISRRITPDSGKAAGA